MSTKALNSADVKRGLMEILQERARGSGRICGTSLRREWKMIASNRKPGARTGLVQRAESVSALGLHHPVAGLQRQGRCVMQPKVGERNERLPWGPMPRVFQPQRGCVMPSRSDKGRCHHSTQPRWGWGWAGPLPRVGLRASVQPWAERRFPVGERLRESVSAPSPGVWTICCPSQPCIWLQANAISLS
jgi:hypothetical protein